MNDVGRMVLQQVSTRLRRFAGSTATCVACSFVALIASPVCSSAQTVTGAVVEVGDGSPVADARLVLVDGAGAVRASAVSDGAGRFSMSLERAGRAHLEVTHIAYAPWETVEFALGQGETIEVEVRLGFDAIPLEPLSVLAARSTRGRLAAFDQRRTSRGGFGGFFLTEEEIERRPTSTTTGLVRAVPGLSVQRRGSGVMVQNVIVAGNCVAHTFIDGIRVTQTAGGSLDDLLVPELIAGIEMYPRGMSAPAQYQDMRDPACGVVLFWTKEPRAGIVGNSGLVRVGLGFGLMAGLLYLIVFGS